MNRWSSLLARAVLVAMPAILAPTLAAAQMGGTVATGGEGMYTFEAYLAQYWFDKPTGFDSRPKAGGFGGRIMVGAPYKPGGSFFSRPAFGVFATYTGKQNIFSDESNGQDVGFEVSSLHVGGQLDWKFLPEPAGGFVDPFVSLGAGLFRTTVDVTDGTILDIGDGNNSTNKFALTPAIGANFTIQRGMSIGIRGDLRDMIIFSDDRFSDSKTTHNWVAEGGLSFTF